MRKPRVSNDKGLCLSRGLISDRLSIHQVQRYTLTVTLHPNMPIASSAVQHRRPVFNPSRIQCTTCRRSFRNRSGLTQHTRQRKSPIPISQPRCPSTQLYRRPDVGRCPGNRRMVITPDIGWRGRREGVFRWVGRTVIGEPMSAGR